MPPADADLAARAAAVADALEELAAAARRGDVPALVLVARAGDDVYRVVHADSAEDAAEMLDTLEALAHEARVATGGERPS